MSQQMQISPGAVLAGRFVVGEFLGRGGQGQVWSATDQTTGAPVAVKILTLPTDPEESQQVMEGLRHEVGALLAVHSPHCLQVVDVVVAPGWAALVTDIVPGVSLRELIDTHGAATPVQALNVLYGALTGLAQVHAAQLLHGDVKPANILVDPQGGSRLIDFGLAGPHRRLSSGTPAYMSPEQVSGRVVADARSDVYSCGAVLFELLTGQRPFAGDGVVQAHPSQPLPDPRGVVAGIPEEVAALIGWSMHQDPSQRPQTALQFREGLDAAATRSFGVGWQAAAGGAVGSVAGAVGALLVSGIGGVSGATGAASTAAAAASLGTSGVVGAVGAGAAASGATTAGTAASAAGLVSAKAVVASVVAVAAVGGGGYVAVQQLAEPEAPEAAAPVAMDRSIETFDLANALWFPSRGDEALQLVNGSADRGNEVYQLGQGTKHSASSDIVFGDFNHDNYLDLAAPFWSGEQNSEYAESWYIWLWDPTGSTAVQLEQPLGPDMYVADLEVAVVDSGLSLSTTSHDPERITRQVVEVVDEWAVATIPTRSAPEDCRTDGTEVFGPAPGEGMRVAPSAQAPAIDMFGLGQVAYGPPPRDVKGWSWATARVRNPDADPEVPDVVCGWVPSTVAVGEVTAARAANLVVPDGSCAGTWGPHGPIQLREGKGDGTYVDDGGVSIQGSEFLGAVDVTGDGAKELFLEVACSGTPIARCCAGRASIVNAVLVLDLSRGTPQRVGETLWGVDDPLTGDARDFTDTPWLEGADLVAPQQRIYGEWDGTQEHLYPTTIRYHWNGAEWETSEE